MVTMQRPSVVQRSSLVRPLVCVHFRLSLPVIMKRGPSFFERFGGARSPVKVLKRRQNSCRPTFDTRLGRSWSINISCVTGCFLLFPYLFRPVNWLSYIH